MPSIHRNIWNKFGIKDRDTLPFNGAPWNTKTTRVTLAELFFDLGFKEGAEIGVERGRFSRVLCDVNPNLHLICVDPWKAFHHNNQEKNDARFEDTKTRLAGKNVTIMRMTSLEASQMVPDNSLDFVYIDALHEFDNAMMDTILWSPKVHSGGIVSGHDYINYYQFGIIAAVNAYTRANNINMWYITTEDIPSWFWVKP